MKVQNRIDGPYSPCKRTSAQLSFNYSYIWHYCSDENEEIEEGSSYCSDVRKIPFFPLIEEVTDNGDTDDGYTEKEWQELWNNESDEEQPEIVEFDFSYIPVSENVTYTRNYNFSEISGAVKEIKYVNDCEYRVVYKITLRPDEYLMDRFFGIVNKIDWTEKYSTDDAKNRWNVEIKLSNGRGYKCGGSEIPENGVLLTHLAKAMYVEAGFKLVPFIF